MDYGLVLVSGKLVALLKCNLTGIYKNDADARHTFCFFLFADKDDHNSQNDSHKD